jgi:XTP/dITP diphosphohydrolase
MTSLVIATRNRHKVQEIQVMLTAAVRCLSLADFPAAPTVVEDAPTFAGNASKKAVMLARWLAETRALSDRMAERQWHVLADDSGLEVDALGGAPGVHSARFATLDEPGESQKAGNSPDAANNAKLLRLLADVPAEQRTARFRCVLALSPILAPGPRPASEVCYADEIELETTLFDGVCEGRIGFEARGSNGFGYDPLFVPNGHQQTFAELGDAAKNRISHRARALEKLKASLANRT